MTTASACCPVKSVCDFSQVRNQLARVEDVEVCANQHDLRRKDLDGVCAGAQSATRIVQCFQHSAPARNPFDELSRGSLESEPHAIAVGHLCHRARHELG